MPAKATTPMMKQYWELKGANPDAILLFRCGDFYETYAEDAEEAGRILNIIVTRKSAGADGMVPMAGVPYHAIDTYLAKLVRAGKRVALAEQTEDPKKAKGLVERQVVRVITPGTAVEEGIIDDKSNNYILALDQAPTGPWGIGLADISTGYFALTEIAPGDAEENLLTEISRLEPREILLPEDLNAHILSPVLAESQISITRIPRSDFRREVADRVICEHFRVQTLDGFGASDYSIGVGAAGALLQYLKDTQKSSISHIYDLSVRVKKNTMVIDSVTQRSLELVRNQHSGGREATLLSVLDRTNTPMGSRMLRRWILEPLCSLDEINARLDTVELINANLALRQSLRSELGKVRDIERIVSRASVGTAGPRDLATLRSALQALPEIKKSLSSTSSALLNTLADRIDLMEDLKQTLSIGLVEDPPATMRDSGIIRPGYSDELDEITEIAHGGKSFIAKLKAQEADRLGLSNIKVGYNKVFGYYLELSHAQIRQLENGVPEDYIRKQTLTSGERYITPSLKEKEELVLNAEARISEIEQRLFQEMRELVSESARPLIQTAQQIAQLDCLLSISEVSLSQGYIKPELNDEGRLEIKEGRHPVLESLQHDPPFVPNDTLLNVEEFQISLITGPNMAGKSTYIRQVALITLMAHMGAFVPASFASIPLRDRIFTRVGAMDHLARGQSTFLVEMVELANILRHATDQSLVILDEIGRGTSTYDGLSIAWSVCEYLHNAPNRQALTLFATHYHELTELEEALPQLKNLSVAVDESDDRITFLYQIVRGKTDRSYGIHAADLAGVPQIAVQRAREILNKLELGEPVAARVSQNIDSRKNLVVSGTRKSVKLLPTVEPWEDQQLSLFENSAPNPAIERLRNLDPNRLTPIEALGLLSELKRDAEGS